MQTSLKMLMSLGAGAALMAASCLPASAACTRLAFSVNDYGKEGPTRDAKELLDKYIAKTMAAKGVSKYTTGKKDVTCELFLNFIVFDEHTCKAEATVCWDGTALPKSEQISAEGNDGKQATGSIEKPAQSAAEKPAKKKAPEGAVATVKENPPAKAEATKEVPASAASTPAASTEHAAVKELEKPAEVAPVKPADAPAPAAAQ